MNPEKLDWEMASEHPDIKVFVGFLGNLLAEEGVTSGPASEFVRQVEELTASRYANETNRVLRVQTEREGRQVSFDVIVQVAAPTIRKAGPED